jgi:hypothetical protein
MPYFDEDQSWHEDTRSAREKAVQLIAMLLLVAGGLGLLVALLALGGCAGTNYCHMGSWGFEIQLQAALAGLGFAAVVIMEKLVRRKAYRLAAAALVFALMSFAACAILLDAATNGWDDLRVFWLG